MKEMNDRETESLLTNLKSLYETVYLIKQNEDNILDLYIEVQSNFYEVAEEDEEQFEEILYQEIKGFLDKTDTTLRLLKRSPFLLSTPDETEVLETAEDFQKCTNILNFLIGEIGAENIADIDDKYDELNYEAERAGDDLEEETIEQLEELSLQRKYLNELVDEVLELSSELEVLLEFEDAA